MRIFLHAVNPREGVLIEVGLCWVELVGRFGCLAVVFAAGVGKGRSWCAVNRLGV